MLEEHDGCVGCCCEDKEEHEFPCSDCKGTKLYGTEEHKNAPDLYNNGIYECGETKPLGSLNINPDRLTQLEEENKMLRERIQLVNDLYKTNEALVNNLLHLLSNPYLVIRNVSEG